MSLADHIAGCVFNLDPRPIATGTAGLTTDFGTTLLHATPPETLSSRLDILFGVGEQRPSSARPTSVCN
jgi:hypothetical protein